MTPERREIRRHAREWIPAGRYGDYDGDPRFTSGVPADQRCERPLLSAYRRQEGDVMSTYAETYRRSLADPEAFWLDAATAVDWDSFPTRALDDSDAPMYQWFPDGVLNTCFNALDRHVRDGRGEQDALIWDSAMTSTVAKWTYREL